MESQVWIPSKGRPGPVFSSVLQKAQIHHTIWVEPHEEAEYRSKTDSPYVSFRVLEKSDQGISYVRQLMLDECRDQKLKVFIFDDDVRCFLKVYEPEDYKTTGVRKRDKIETLEAFEESEKLFVKEGFAYGSYIFSLFAWGSKPGFSKRKAQTGSIWLNGELLPKDVNYDKTSGREDLYFVSHLMLSGAICGIYFDIAVDHAPVAHPKMKGGLAEWYSNWQNVVDADRFWKESMDRKKDAILAELPTEVSKKFLDKSLYKSKVIRMGTRKGLVDTSPNWKNIADLRNAYFQGKLAPI